MTEPELQHFQLSRRAIISLALLTGLLVLPFLLPFSLAFAVWWIEVKELTHFFGFAAIELALLSVCNWRNWNQVWVATGIALFLCVASELFQLVSNNGRAGSIEDVVNNCLGVSFAFLSCYAIAGDSSRLSRGLAVTAATLIIVLISQPLHERFTQDGWRKAQLPVLYDFSSDWAQEHVGVIHTARSNSVPPELQKLGYTESFTFPNHIWGGIVAYKVWSKWRDYNKLIIDVHAISDGRAVDGSVVLQLVTNHWHLEPEWISTPVRIEQGQSSIVIPFENFLINGVPVDFEHARVQYVEIAKWKSPQPLTIVLKRIYLE